MTITAEVKDPGMCLYVLTFSKEKSIHAWRAGKRYTFRDGEEHSVAAGDEEIPPMVRPGRDNQLYMENEVIVMGTHTEGEFGGFVERKQVPVRRKKEVKGIIFTGG